MSFKRKLIKRITFCFIFTVFLMAAETPDPYTTAAQDIESILKCAQQRIKQSQSTLSLWISKDPTNPYTFKDSSLNLATQKTLKLKTDIQNLAKEVEFNPYETDAQFNTVRNILGRYLNISATMQAMFAQAFHATKVVETNKTLSFENLKMFDLVLPPITAIGALITPQGELNYPNNIRNEIDANGNVQTRITMSHQERQLAELSALMNPKSERDYAKLVQFAIIRDTAVNRWAINRMSVDAAVAKWVENRKPTSTTKTQAGIQACGQNLLSFRTSTPIQDATMLPSILELQNSDGYAMLRDKTKDISQAIINHSLIDPIVISKIINDTFSPFQSKMAEASFSSWVKQKAVEVINDEKEILNSTIDSFVLASHSIYDKMDVESILNRQASMMYYFRINNIKTKINLIARQYSAISLSALNKSFDQSAKLNINKSAWIAEEKALLKPVISKIMSDQAYVSRAFANRNKKVDSILDSTISAIPAMYELKFINETSTKDEKLKQLSAKAFTITPLKLGIQNVEELKLFLESKMSANSNDYLLKTYQSSEYVKTKLNELFKNIEDDAKANPTIPFATIASRNAARFQLKLKTLRNEADYPKTDLKVKQYIAKQDNLKVPVKYVTFVKLGEDACGKKPSQTDDLLSSFRPVATNSGLGQLAGTSEETEDTQLMDPATALNVLLSTMNLSVLNIWLDNPDVQKNGVLKDNTQLLPTLYDHKIFAQAQVSLVMAQNQFLSIQWQEKNLLEHLVTSYSPTTGKTDRELAKKILHRAIDEARYNDKGKLEMFCRANYDVFNKQSTSGQTPTGAGKDFQDMYRAASATRSALTEGNADLMKYEELLTKKARTKNEKFMEDFIHPILTYSFIAMLVIGFILLPMVTGTVVAPVLTTMLTILNWGVMAPTCAANLYSRLTVNFIEKPAEFRFEGSVANSHVGGSPNPELEGGPIASQEMLAMKRAELKMNQKLEPIFLAMDLFYGKVLYHEAKTALGFGVKSASRKLNINVRDKYTKLDTFKPKRSFTEIQKEKGTYEALKTKASEGFDQLARKFKLPIYQNITEGEIQNALRTRLGEELPKDIKDIIPEIERAKKFVSKRLGKFSKSIMSGKRASNILGNEKIKLTGDELPIDPEVIMQLGSQKTFMTIYGMFPKSFMQMLWKTSKGKIQQIVSTLKGGKPTPEQLKELYQIVSSDAKIKAWWKQWGEFTTVINDMRLMFLKDKVAGYEGILNKIKFAQENSLTNAELVTTFTDLELQLLNEAGTLHRNIGFLFVFDDVPTFLGMMPDVPKPGVMLNEPPLFKLRHLFNASNELRMSIRPIHPFMTKLSESELSQYEPTHYYDAATDTYVPMDAQTDARAWSRSAYDFDGKDLSTESQKQIFKMLPESFNSAASGAH